MAGYEGFSKSNNAISAEESGKFPISKASKIIAKKYGVTQEQANAFLKTQVPDEWHHTSKAYNKTNYYNVDLEQDEIESLKKIELQKAEEKAVNIIASWIEWSGFGRSARKSEKSYKGQVISKGNFFIFPDGSKKNKFGNSFNYKYLYL